MMKMGIRIFGFKCNGLLVIEEGLLQSSLHGADSGLGLALPAGKVGAVVLDGETEDGHGGA